MVGLFLEQPHVSECTLEHPEQALTTPIKGLLLEKCLSCKIPSKREDSSNIGNICALSYNSSGKGLGEDSFGVKLPQTTST